LGDEADIGVLREFLEEKLKDIPHCYGEHGDCGIGKEYKGEANDWGTKGWEKGVSLLEFGSELALELVENKDKLGISDEYKKNVMFYADRYTHLFLNQISSLLDEVDFYLMEGVGRLAYRIAKDRRPSVSDNKILSTINPIVKSIVEQTKRKIREEVEALVMEGKL